MQENLLLVILGATASGKTKLAVALADELDGEIISADSRQVFKRMDIGTGKDLKEYTIGSKHIPYHLIDILEPGERYHVDAFKNDFFEAFEDINERNKIPILCGGTGMYIQNVLQNQTYTAVPANEHFRQELEQLDREVLVYKLRAYEGFDSGNVDFSSKKRLTRAIVIAEYLKHHTLPEIKRPDIQPIVFGLKNELVITRSKILERLDRRLQEGMIEEVEDLLKNGLSPEMLVFYGLEYKFIAMYLLGELDFEALKTKLGIAICQYAKRQNTYFRKMEKDGIHIHWLDAAQSINLLKQEVLQKVFDK